MVIVNEKFKSDEVLRYLSSLAEDVDTENLDETGKNIGKAKNRGGSS